MKSLNCNRVAFITTLNLACIASAQTPSYRVTDLGPDVSVAGINNSGQICGCISVAGQMHAFRTPPNSRINPTRDDLGTLGGLSSCATGINSSGEVVGNSTTDQGEMRGFRTSANAKINPATDDLGSLGGPLVLGSIRTEANGINDAGEVVGLSAATSGIAHAFRTGQHAAINPATDDIGALAFAPMPANLQSVARSINASGDVVGVFQGTQNTAPTAFFYSRGSIVEIPNFILAPQGNNFTGVSNSDRIVGTRVDSSSFPPSISSWHNGTLTDLAACDCEPLGINSSSQVVGRGFGFGPNHAFLISHGQLFDLNNVIPAGSGWVLRSATAINDLGQIIGTGLFNGVSHAFRLDPATN